MRFFRLILATITSLIALLVLTPVMLVVLPFWLVSLLTRLIARMLEPKFLTRNQLIRFDPVFGWKAYPNLDTHHLMGDLFHIRTDNEGLRGNASVEESEIVVFGDSFAAGYGVGEKHFFANLTRTKIKPVGIGGYSMVQELIQMRQLQSRLNSKLVVWFIYYGNDLYDNLMPDLRGYRKPFVRETAGGGWEIVSSHLRPESWPIVSQGRMHGENHMPRLGELCSDTFVAKRAYAACDYLLSAGKEICDDASAQLWVMGIPDAWQLTAEGQQRLKALAGDLSSFDPNFPDHQIQRACDRLGVGFLAGRSFLDASCYKSNDCHWNEEGHARVSQALVRLKHQKPIRTVSAAPSAAGTLVQA